MLPLIGKAVTLLSNEEWEARIARHNENRSPKKKATKKKKTKVDALSEELNIDKSELSGIIESIIGEAQCQEERQKNLL